MSEAEHIAEALDGFFGNPENGWFTPITVAIQGLSAAQAACVPAPRFNSVWALVNHVRYCSEYMLLRLQGRPIDYEALGAKDDWPPAGQPSVEQGWRAACERMIAVNTELAEFTRTLSDEQLDEPLEPGRPKRWQIIQGVITHNSYHACEMISVRHMQGLWLERT